MEQNNDLSDVNKLLFRFGIYVYDKDVENKLMMMKLEVEELYRHQLISKEEYLHALLMIRNGKK